ncbi:NUDT22 [Bugula neritina]|uniref:NUDT22 n=1 Tax=Bugula neritina TaxID=10212 RepID=A0A7J7KJ06_BUGNE|nr:NUDT22 [Bugula neritina]
MMRTRWDLGLTCYKDFLGTNFSPDADLLQEMGKNVAGNLQAFMADPLGVGCVLLTSDNQIVLLKRSGECAEAPLLYDVPGGHPEPGEISGDALNASLFTPEAIVTEIFSSILREVRDEVNLPLHSLSSPLLLGVALNKHSHNRPSSEYLVRTELSGSEVTTLYNTGNQSEASESTQVHLVSHDQLMNMQQTNFWQDLAPSAKGCFLLYQDFVKRSCCTQR